MLKVNRILQRPDLLLIGTNDHFGTVQDLKDLSAALHARGMYLMVDVVSRSSQPRIDIDSCASTGCKSPWRWAGLDPFSRQWSL